MTSKKLNIVVIDYGVGNLRSVDKTLETIGYKAIISSDISVIKTADMIVLPGQGAFATAKAHLEEMGLIEFLKDHIRQQKPYLGICLGFHLLFETSEEHGLHEGFGVFPGHIRHFQRFELPIKIPHMGWNTLSVKQDSNHVFEGLPSNPYVYFVHSYFLESTAQEIVSATTEYGREFVSVVQQPNLLATQFHPEKSGQTGLHMLKQFFNHIHKGI